MFVKHHKWVQRRL